MHREDDTPRIRLIEIMLAVGTFVSIVAALSFTSSDYGLELFFGIILAIFIVSVFRCYIGFAFPSKIHHGFWSKVMSISFGWLIMFPIVALIVDLIIQDRVSLMGKILSTIFSVIISFGIGGLWFGLSLAKVFEDKQQA